MTEPVQTPRAPAAGAQIPRAPVEGGSAARRQRLHPELVILALLSAVLHFWRLFTPRAVVFDELHYEHFAGYYLDGSFFMDVHPPLGRLTFTAIAALLHVPSSALVAGQPVPALRVLPAIFGTLLVPLMFILLRQLGASRRAATLGATAILLDNGLLVASRVALPDIFLIVFGIASICAFLEARVQDGVARWVLLASSAALAGCALSVKWTGASALGIVLATWAIDVFVEARDARAAPSRRVREALVLVGIPTLVYVATWAEHFALLTHSGPGNVSMSARFQAQLPGTAAYDPAAPRVSLWEKIREVHHAIRYGNGSLENITHPASSPWYTWPIMKHPIALWEASPGSTGPRTMLILLGNPAVWWGALLGAALCVLGVASRRFRLEANAYGFIFLVGSVLLNYVPFAAIRRVMYLYHYLFALTLLVALAAFSVGVMSDGMRDDGPPWRFPDRGTAVTYTALAGVIVVGFLYFAPFTYGLTLSPMQWDARMWVLHPRF